MRAEIGDTTLDGVTVIVQNSDPYTYFGRRPIRICEGADNINGRLSAAVLKSATPLEIPTLIPRLFTSDPAVLATVRSAWWYLALMQPAAAVVFVLDGVLIGAGDTAYLAAVTTGAGLLVYLPLALLAGAAGLGLGGVWFGLTCFVLVRLAACLVRMRGTRWWRRGMEAARAW